MKWLSHRWLTFPHLRTVTAAGALAAGLVEPASAQSSPANVAAGRRLAQQWCAQCHVVTRENTSGWTNAPPFPTIAERPSTKRDSLIAFIEGPHLDMVHMGRNPQDASDIAAYILSLRKQ